MKFSSSMAALILVVDPAAEHEEVHRRNREDDRKLGIHSTALWFGRYAEPIIASLQIAVVSGLLILAYYYQLHAPFYLALFAAALVFIFQQYLIRIAQYQRAFLSNQWFGALIFLGLFFERFVS